MIPIVLPTRALIGLGPREDADHTPYHLPSQGDTPGLKLIASGYGTPVGRTTSGQERPISSRHRMIETLTIHFEDVQDSLGTRIQGT